MVRGVNNGSVKNGDSHCWQQLPPSDRSSHGRALQAVWVDWQPRGADAASWRLWKLGQQVDPGAVLRNGSHSMHAVGDRGFHVDAAAHDGPERLSFRCSPWTWHSCASRLDRLPTRSMHHQVSVPVRA